MSKKIATGIVLIIILIATVVIGRFILLENRPMLIPTLNNQQKMSLKSAESNQRNQAEVSYKESEAPVCNKGTNSVSWDESKNGAYYIPGDAECD